MKPNRKGRLQRKQHVLRSLARIDEPSERNFTAPRHSPEPTAASSGRCTWPRLGSPRFVHDIASHSASLNPPAHVEGLMNWPEHIDPGMAPADWPQPHAVKPGKHERAPQHPTSAGAFCAHVHSSSSKERSGHSQCSTIPASLHQRQQLQKKELGKATKVVHKTQVQNLPPIYHGARHCYSTAKSRCSEHLCRGQCCWRAGTDRRVATL